MTDESSLTAQAEQLRSMHHRDTPLVLPNVWDAGSAKVVAAAGFQALATGSAPIATSLGYPDHEARRWRRCSPPPAVSSARWTYR